MGKQYNGRSFKAKRLVAEEVIEITTKLGRFDLREEGTVLYLNDEEISDLREILDALA